MVAWSIGRRHPIASLSFYFIPALIFATLAANIFW